ncbi:MAG: phosphate ABC transporter permease PstA [Lachnospiraceae bacterium]|nr:phosphate ABC transporter permease PstA [Lachnospiraceae bacterium]
MISIYGRKKRIYDMMLYALIYMSAGISVVLLVGIVGFVFWNGLDKVNWSFLTSTTSILKGTVGIAGNILNTLYIIILTMLIATPIGVGAAVYLNEYAKSGKFVKLIELATETLAGIPSIIFGLFGMIFFGETLGLSYSILTGTLTMTLMVLPLVTRNTQEALKTVPDSYRIGAVGLGTGKWYMIRTILLPSAMPGIITGVILAIGRIVGESAALLYTAGSGDLLPTSVQGYLDKIFESGGTLTIQLYLSMSKGENEVAFGIAVVLLVIVFGINCLTKYMAKRFDVN